jgi:hypothetical protein
LRFCILLRELHQGYQEKPSFATTIQGVYCIYTCRGRSINKINALNSCCEGRFFLITLIQIANTDVTPQAIWPVAKSLTKRETNCNSWSFRPNFSSLEKANAVADCLENQFTLHDLCDENHKRQVEASVQTLLEARENNSP